MVALKSVGLCLDKRLMPGSCQPADGDLHARGLVPHATSRVPRWLYARCPIGREPIRLLHMPTGAKWPR